jgi:type 1 glutamine amidotransferase
MPRQWVKCPGMAWLMVLLAAVAIVMAPSGVRADDEAGFKSLFNGKDLTGWEGNPAFWSVRDEAITGQTTEENPTQGNTFIIWRDGTVDDFVLRLQYRIVNGNSGIQYRSREFDNWVVGGYQGDFEAGDRYSGILYEEKLGRGILAERGQKVVIDAEGKKNVAGSVGDSAEIQAKIKKEDWNDYEIIAAGNRLIHKINGLTTVDVTDEQAAKRSMSGILALQLHAGPPMTVQFRNIRLKRTKLTNGAKKIVMVSGRSSHRPGDHEFHAGVLLLKKCLDQVPGIVSVVYKHGWPSDPTAFDNADAILFYMDGGAGHPVIQGDRLIQINRLAKQGIGIACAHYAVEVPKERGGPEFLDWIGGYFETDWSVNPHWVAKFESLPEHPITRGVKPLEINDEWYYHMRFRENMEHTTPILTAIPPKSTLSRPDGPHSGNPHVRATAGQPQHVAWAVEREDGGRGFGFTGGHYHKNWGDDNFRKLFLNALVWVAKAEVPAEGIASSISPEDLEKDLDPKGKK